MATDLGIRVSHEGQPSLTVADIQRKRERTGFPWSRGRYSSMRGIA